MQEVETTTEKKLLLKILQNSQENTCVEVTYEVYISFIHYKTSKENLKNLVTPI